jgi:TolB protein
MRLNAIISKVLLILTCGSLAALAQTDWIRTGTGLGQERVRLAVADFKTSSTDAQAAPLLKTFNDTLYADLDNAGIFDLVSKSFMPLAQPAEPREVRLDAWSNPPAAAAMLAFGNLNVTGTTLAVNGWLDDVKNTQTPVVLGKQYTEEANEHNARIIAHRFANEIIFRLGGGIPGVAESKLYFISNRTGHKEVWAMDYDGYDQHRITSLGSITLSPRVSPDGSRLAFSSYGKSGLDIMMYSIELGRIVAFPHYGGTNITPAWSPDGTRLAWSSSMPGDSEIYVADATGSHPKRLTNFRGPDVAPVWNPKTGAQIAFVSGRSGLPQIYIMDADGTNVQRLTDQGYAVSPSWSPNGQFLAFSWDRKYGPGAPGGWDIYVMDIATKQFIQLTHDAGRNDYPVWSADGRHLAFQRGGNGREQIWTMLADGTKQRQVTSAAGNQQPAWSTK